VSVAYCARCLVKVNTLQVNDEIAQFASIVQNVVKFGRRGEFFSGKLLPVISLMALPQLPQCLTICSRYYIVNTTLVLLVPVSWYPCPSYTLQSFKEYQLQT